MGIWRASPWKLEKRLKNAHQCGQLEKIHKLSLQTVTIFSEIFPHVNSEMESDIFVAKGLLRNLEYLFAVMYKYHSPALLFKLVLEYKT